MCRSTMTCAGTGRCCCARRWARRTTCRRSRSWTRSGMERMIDQARRMGITTFDRSTERFGLALTLGGGEVRLLELTAAYACLGHRRAARVAGGRPRGGRRGGADGLCARRETARAACWTSAWPT